MKKTRGLRHNYFKVTLITVLIMIVVLLAYFLVKDVDNPKLILDFIKQAKTLTEHYFFLSWVIFIGVYILIAAFFTPGIWIMNLAAGYFFGIVFGTIGANIGCTLGSLVMFLIARHFFGPYITKKFGERFKKFDKMYKQDGANFFLFLRLTPGFPAMMINFFAGSTQAKVRTFLWTTSLGMLPAELIYTFAGQQARVVTSAKDIMTPGMLFALALLGGLSLMPILIKRRRGAYEEVE